MEDKIYVGYPSFAEFQQTFSLIKNIISSSEHSSDKVIQHDLAEYSQETIEKIFTNTITSKPLEKGDVPRYITIAKVNDIVAGFCTYTVDKKIAWIEWFGIDPNFSQHNLSDKLASFTQKDIKDRQCLIIKCFTTPSNKESAALILRNGFNREGEVTLPVYNEVFYLWQKTLS